MPSALDLNVEELARLAEEARQQERYQPRSGAVAPMNPNPAGPPASPYEPPPVYGPGAPESNVNQLPGPRPASAVAGAPEGDINQLAPMRQASAVSGAPEGDINQLAPMRQASAVSGAPEGVQTGLTGVDRDLELQRAQARRMGGPAPPGSALGAEGAAAGLEPVDPRFQPPGPIESWLKRQRRFVKDKEPEMPKEPATEYGGAFHGDRRQFEAGVPPDKGAATVTSAPAGATTPVKTPAPKPNAAPKKQQLYGAPASSAVEGDKPVPMTPRQSISPRAYVDLAQSNPALYNMITNVAGTVDVGAWDLTNVMMASSRGNPDHREGGRIGLTGLTREDVAWYQSTHPELFKNAEGQPLDPAEPVTNLMLGALKLKDLYAQFGTRTDGAIAAYHGGSDAINAASRMTRGDQKHAISDDTAKFTAQVKSGSSTPPDSAPTPAVTGRGTGTPQGYAQAASRAAETGDTGIFASYAVRAAPGGMSSTDLWRQAENALVNAFLSKGSIEGAVRAREMVFQQSQVGTTTELMKAYQALDNNDAVGAATHLARGYFYAPDGGQAQFTVTNNGIWGQRYNEHDGNPAGKPFKVTKEGILSMLNITRDPQAFAKHVREEQKSLAEIADKKSLVRWRDVTQPAIQAGHDATRLATNAATNQRATEIAEQNRNEATRRAVMQQNAAGARLAEKEKGEWGRLGYRSQAEYDRAMDVAGLKKPSVTGAPTDVQLNTELGQIAMGQGITPDKPAPAAFQKFGAYYVGMRTTGTAGPQARGIADGLTRGTGQYGLSAVNDGSGRVAVVDKANPKVGIAYLPPDVLSRVGIGTAPAGPPPASPVGATPAPASAGR